MKVLKVTVVGSINMDVVNRVREHPLPGETIIGEQTIYSPGGKGANQAIAAARSGAEVCMVGAVGNDAFAGPLLEVLDGNEIDRSFVQHKETNTGLAFITVNQKGENTIVLSQGANGLLSKEDVFLAQNTIAASDVLLLQNEIPWATTVYAMKIAKAHGVKVILNPAPARKIEQAEYPLIDLLVMNELETKEIFGEEIVSVKDALAAGKRIVQNGIQSVLITLGESGSVHVDLENELCTPAFGVKAVDTTAAGDTFIGAFASVDLKKSRIEEVLRFASAASAITVTRQGAQSSIPGKEEIEHWLEEK
jgi:ribokinase